MREGREGVTNILTANANLKGNLKIEGGIRVDGMIEGEIEVNDTLILGKGGMVKGIIKTKNALIGGKVIGDIKGQGKIELKSGSIVTGDIICKKLVIEEGAIFDGLCKMSEGKVSPKIEEKKIFQDKGVVRKA